MGPHIEHHWFGSGFNFRHTKASLLPKRDLLFENDRTWLENKQDQAITQIPTDSRNTMIDDAITHIQRHNPVG